MYSLHSFFLILCNNNTLSESKTVSFDITADALSFWNQQMEYVCESGEFQVFIGPDSSTQNVSSFTLK